MLTALGTVVGIPVVQAAASGGTITVGGECLQDVNAGTGDGNPVALANCDGSAQQSWSWGSGGTVTVFGKCLEVTGGSNATGALVSLHSCTGGTNQAFSWQPDGTVYGAKSGKCLAAQGTVAAGAAVGLAPCDPSQSAQLWNAANGPVQSQVTVSVGSSGSFSQGSDTPSSPFIDKDGTFYFQNAVSQYGATDTRAWSFYTGSDFDHASTSPISSQGTNPNTTTLCNNSPTGVNATAGGSYSQPNFCDLVGVWVDPDTGDWYGLVHNEFNGSPFGDPLHYDAIDYAKSTNQGASWTIVGHAVTSPDSTTRNDTTAFPNQTYYWGDGDPRLFVDYRSGYFYVFYFSRVVDKATGSNILHAHVARAPISGKMASASWTKFYNGSWQSPGLGGAESDMIPSNGIGNGYMATGDEYTPSQSGTGSQLVAAGSTPPSSQLAVMSVAWDAYLGQYIGFPAYLGSTSPFPIFTTPDLATQKWTYAGLVGPSNTSWYRWLVDAGNRTSSTTLGKTLRLYCGVQCGSWEGYTNLSVNPITSTGLPAPVTPGLTYQIAAGNGLYLAQNGTSLTTAPSGAGSSANWSFSPTGDGFYSIANAATGQVIGVDSTTPAGRAWDAPATVTAPGMTPALGQQWSLQSVVQSPTPSGSSTPTGSWRLVNRYSNLALSLTGGTLPVATAPQRSWDNQGTAGDTRPVSAQSLALNPVGGTAGNVVTVTYPGNQNATAATAITPLAISAGDSATGAALTYSASGLPDGLSVNSSTGTISGTPTSPGTFTAVVTATDSSGAAGFTSFTWTVNAVQLGVRLPQSRMSIKAVDSQETAAENGRASNVLDGNSATSWVTSWSTSNPPMPHTLDIDLGGTYQVASFYYLPRQNNNNANIADYQIYLSTDGTTWGSPVASGTWPNTLTEKTVAIPATTARYVRLEALSDVTGSTWAAAAEINVGVLPTVTPQSQMTVAGFDSQETAAEDGHATNVLDGNTSTAWVTPWSSSTTSYPHYIDLNLGSTQTVACLRYLPRPSSVNGRIANYQVYLSSDGTNWGNPVASGTWANTATEQSACFTPMAAHYIRLMALSEVNGNPWAAVAELNVDHI